MKKIVSLFLLIVLFFTFPIYATTIDMDLADSFEDEISEENEFTDEDYSLDFENLDNYDEDELLTTYAKPEIQSVQSSVSESNKLSLEVVCSIILSSIGLVLIFLAIAILIKIK